MGRFSKIKKTSILFTLIAFTLFCLKFYNDKVNLLEEGFFSKLPIKLVTYDKNLLERSHSIQFNYSVHSFEEQIKMQIDELVIKFKCGVDGIVTVKSGGRLGNIMGEYATLLAISLRDKVFPILQHRTHTTLAKHFKNISIQSIKNLKCPLKWNSMNLRVYNKLNKTERALLARQGIYIDGYPTSVSMFHRHRSKVQRQFIFKSFLTEAAQKELHKLRGSRSDVSYVS